MSWETIHLGEVMDVKHGFPFKGEFFRDSGDLIVLTPGNCYETGGLKLRGDKEKYYEGDYPPEYLLREGDMLVVMTDLVNSAPILGGSLQIPEDNRFLHNQRLGLVRILDPNRIDDVFLYYLLNTHEYRAQVRGSATGATVRHSSPSRIRGCVVKVPRDVKEQRAIGLVLRALDDLVDNNRRRIALLEKAARILYQEWFVRMRFPGFERTLVTDGRPLGWRVARLDSIADCVGGGTPSTSMPEYWDGDITWVTPTDVTRNKHFVLLDTEKKITDAGLRNCSAKLVPGHAILMTSRASVGYFALPGREVCTNQGFVSIVPHNPTLTPFLLLQLVSRVEEIRNLATGSTYLEVSRGKLRGFEVLLPVADLAATFADSVAPFFQQIRLLKQQTQKLMETRGLLLPRLMTGEIAV